MTSMLFEIE